MSTREQLVADLKVAAASARSLPRNMPFNTVVEAFSGFRILPLDAAQPLDIHLLQSLKAAATACAKSVRKNPIDHYRPNDVGDMIETPLKAELDRAGLKTMPPRSPQGHAGRSGYPDIMIEDAAGRTTYIECKTYKPGSLKDTRRSFYVSPSDRLKIASDARHILIGFEMHSEPSPTPGNKLYWPLSCRVVDCFDLQCEVKFEVQSNNPRIYTAPGPGFTLTF